MHGLTALRFGEGPESFELFVDAKNPGPFDRVLIEDRPIPDTAALARAFLRGRGTLIDIGANVGTVAVSVAKSGSRVLAIELLPENCMRLRLAREANGLQSAMRVVERAVTSVNGPISYAGSEAWGHVTEESDRQTRGETLDTILELYEAMEPGFLVAPLFIKVDVEGHESEVFKGGAATIASWRPPIVFESIEHAYEPPDRTREARQTLVDHGYDVFAVRENILVPRRVDDLQESLVTDFLAVPSEARDWCPVDYEVRPLAQHESLAWVVWTCAATDEHRQHAHAVLSLWLDRARHATSETALSAQPR